MKTLKARPKAAAARTSDFGGQPGATALRDCPEFFGKAWRSTRGNILTLLSSAATMPNKLCALLLAVGAGAAAGSPVFAQPAFRFDFTGGPAEAGWTSVTPTTFYSAETGYGFEPGASLRPENLKVASVTSTNPFYFSVKVPEGNYRVTVTLDEGSVTTIKAEQRRLMVEHKLTAKGKTAIWPFVVNVRTPRISATAKVNLKKRELETETVDWDEKLTIEFNDVKPCLSRLQIEKVDVPTVFIAGDSTVCDQPAEPWNSWGQMLPRFFKPDVAVANYAESGESLKSSLGARRFEKIFSLMRPGDYLFVQFGHNDMKDKATNALAIYRANLAKIIAETRAKGGTPVLVTSMERKNGVEHATLAGYPQSVRDVAKENECALIDLNAMSQVFYRALGPDLDKAFQDGTHHNNYGSYELAKCVITGIRQEQLPLAKSIVEDFGDFNPALPDAVAAFALPASPSSSSLKPLGN